LNSNIFLPTDTILKGDKLQKMLYSEVTAPDPAGRIRCSPTPLVSWGRGIPAPQTQTTSTPSASRSQHISHFAPRHFSTLMQAPKLIGWLCACEKTNAHISSAALPVFLNEKLKRQLSKCNSLFSVPRQTCFHHAMLC